MNRDVTAGTDPHQWNEQHGGRLAAMIAVAQAAGDHTLKYFRSSGLAVEAKSDESPVTVADREAEQLVRTMLAEKFPTDTLQGEEFGDQTGTSDYRWIVDPIDGTKSFVCGVPLYSTLLAVEHNREPLAGVIVIPAGGEMIAAATGQGAWYRSFGRQPDGSAEAERHADWQRARVSEKNKLSDAVFVTSQVDAFEQRGAAEGYKRLEKAAWLTRSWGDGFGYLMVATGRADVMVDPECNPWDVAAILPIITEAGGRFTTWKGEVTTRGGDGLGTNGRLHDEVLKALAL